jgi:hypothetical protein
MVGTVWFTFISFIAVNVPVRCFPIVDTIAISRRARVLRICGLYDAKPRPRLEPSDDQVDKIREDNNDDDIMSVERLFSIQKDGRERRGLLPPLRRRIDSGVACYFEPNDKQVLNLIDKTSCNPYDACWALEACNGDITEAWTRISFARRMMLNKLRNTQLVAEDPDYDVDDYNSEVAEAYEKQKNEVKAQINQRNSDEYFDPVKPGVHWTPIKNPNPIENEPWFTG